MNCREENSKKLALLAGAAGILAFWILRGWYWLQIHELPFSDMADFERIAHGILDRFDFSYTPFWQSYKSPTLPVLGALVWGVAGKGDYFAWRIFQNALLCGGLVWLAVEIVRYTGVRLWGVLLIWAVALSKPSIFYSYKYATETPAEAMIYLVAAGWLWSMRKQSLRGFMVTGMLVSVSILNRPNYAVQAAFICLAIVLISRIRLPHETLFFSKKMRGIFLAGFLFGMSVVWLPWIARGYALYGNLVPMNTSGGHSLIFELGKVNVTLPDGTTVNETNNELLAEASNRFANDYLSHKAAERAFFVWVKEDPSRYLRIIWDRFKRTLINHNVSLSRVSRTEVMQGPINNVLIDKSPLLVLFGTLILLAIGLAYSSTLLFLPFVAIAPWWFAILVASTSRYLDPMLPLLGFGTAVGIVAGGRVLLRFVRPKPVVRAQTRPSSLAKAA